MSQAQFSSSKSSKTRERELLYHIVWIYTSKGLQGFEQNTWTKYLNKKLEHNSKRSGFKFNELKNKRENPFSK